MLPKDVWVPLRVLGYDPTQHGDLTDFMGEVQQGWFDDGVYWYGVQFGGAIGWRKVAQADCKTLDFLQHPLPRPYTTAVPDSMPYRAPSLAHNGSIGRLQNQGLRSEDSQSVIGCTATLDAEEGQVTP